MKDDVWANGWNEQLQSFTQAYGSTSLDSSLLLMEHYGFINADDIYFHKTVKAIKKALFHNGLMYRYNVEDDFGQPKSAFTICTFWLIRAFTYSNHLGLFSEDLDFETKEQLGNFPQAYSHLALINTALLFTEEVKSMHL